ncbi:2-hydroxyacid dehydrogenase [Nocardiopsis halotolerans]|uniref:2-hydroxyacid dehydrogenase n=1 Tax=Nocardiopsis halotolerans TaxID=124252 RepID=UPI00034B4C6A|nr:2-hydroxyacid dehydrogenase [Nocardiopsis halotolerans]
MPDPADGADRTRTVTSGGDGPTRRCLVLNDRAPVPTDVLDRVAGPLETHWVQDPSGALDPAREFRRHPDTQILVTTYMDLGARNLRLLPELELVVVTTTAVEYVDLDHCRERGVAVCNTGGYTGDAVAEHAVALMMAVAKNVVPVHARVRAGDMLCAGEQGMEISGKVAGIVGMGHIGSGVARMVRGLGMEVLHANRSPRRVEGSTPVELTKLLSVSDAVFLTLPLNDDSRGLLGAEELALMKPSAVLVSISPDEVLDPRALAAALGERRIRGAGLDLIGGHDPYPELDNLVLSSRFAANTRECQERRRAAWAAAVAAFVEGREPPHRVV